MHVHACTCAHLWRPEIDTVFPISLSLMILEIGFPHGTWNLLGLSRMADQWALGSYLLPQLLCWSYRHLWSCLAFSVWVLGVPNSGPHAYIASTLATESPQIPVWEFLSWFNWGPTLDVDSTISWAGGMEWDRRCNKGDRSEHQHPSLFASWLWKQCKHLPHTSATSVTSLPCPTPLKSEPKETFSSLSHLWQVFGPSSSNNKILMASATQQPAPRSSGGTWVLCSEQKWMLTVVGYSGCLETSLLYSSAYNSEIKTTSTTKYPSPCSPLHFWFLTRSPGKLGRVSICSCKGGWSNRHLAL